MELFLQSVALVLVGVILSIMLNKQSADLGLLLVMAVSCAVCLAAAGYMSSMMEFISEVRLFG